VKVVVAADNCVTVDVARKVAVVVVARLLVTCRGAPAAPESGPSVTTDTVYVPDVAALATLNEPVRLPSEIEHD